MSAHVIKNYLKTGEKQQQYAMSKKFSCSQTKIMLVKDFYKTLVYFDKIQIATLDEDRAVTAAEGGYDNAPRVFWESTRDLKLRFTQGVFSQEHFALLTNSRLIEQIDVPILIIFSTL